MEWDRFGVWAAVRRKVELVKDAQLGRHVGSELAAVGPDMSWLWWWHEYDKTGREKRQWT